MRRDRAPWMILALVGVVLSAGVARARPPAPGAPALPNARTPIDGVQCGGQPTADQIVEAAAAGYRTVINLRGVAEPGHAWEAAAVEGAGMRYVHIPIAGVDDLTRANVERLDGALDEALPRGPVLLHCASGNRIGALLALREAWLRGMAPADALRVGLEAGLTKLEPDVRALLGLPVESAAPSGAIPPQP